MKILFKKIWYLIFGKAKIPIGPMAFTVCNKRVCMFAANEDLFCGKSGLFYGKYNCFCDKRNKRLFLPVFHLWQTWIYLRQTQLFLLQTSFPFATNEIKVCVYVLFICGKRNFILPQKSFSFTTNEIIVCRSRSSFVTNVY